MWKYVAVLVLLSILHLHLLHARYSDSSDLLSCSFVRSFVVWFAFAFRHLQIKHHLFIYEIKISVKRIMAMDTTNTTAITRFLHKYATQSLISFFINLKLKPACFWTIEDRNGRNI